MSVFTVLPTTPLEPGTVTAIVNPGNQCPIAILDGSAGSAKSSTLATLIEILDPKVGAMAGEPSSEDDLVVSAYQSAVMSFDNVDTLARLSDALCRLSTGGGLSKRKLYSDGDVFAVDAMRTAAKSPLLPSFTSARTQAPSHDVNLDLSCTKPS